MKLIDLHWQWMGTGNISGCGLCESLKDTEYYSTLKDFEPDMNERELLTTDREYVMFWGSGLPHDVELASDINAAPYTPRRQSIVLLICAMHNEI